MSANTPIRFPASQDGNTLSANNATYGAAATSQAEGAAATCGHGDRRDSDPLLTVDDVARRLNVTKDWVWDHSSRKAPFLPVIRMGDGTLRYRASRVEEFIDQRERLTHVRKKRA